MFLWESLTPFFSSFFPIVNPLRKRKEKQTYLLGCNDFRAENSHEEYERVCVHVYEFLEAFSARRGRYVHTSDYKILFPVSRFFAPKTNMTAPARNFERIEE